MDIINALAQLDDATRNEASSFSPFWYEGGSQSEEQYGYERGFMNGKAHMHALVRKTIERLVPDFHDRLAERQQAAAIAPPTPK